MGNHSAVYLSVCRSVGRSVSRNQSVGKQSVRKEERNVFRQLVRLVMMMRRREAKGSINTGRCQDTRVSQSTPPQYGRLKLIDLSGIKETKKGTCRNYRRQGHYA